MLIAFNKPYGVLCRFTSEDGRPTLADHVDVPGVYAAGRLDVDSEGLLLLTDDGRLQQAIADPVAKLVKRYWVQVEGSVDDAALARLCRGVRVGIGRDAYTAAAVSATTLAAPALAEREPPIRRRANIPTAWLELGLAEGRNRQVRRMTAAVGLPTLRLVRIAIGDVDLRRLDLAPGAWRRIDASIIPTVQFDTKGPRRASRPGSTRATRRRYGADPTRSR